MRVEEATQTVGGLSVRIYATDGGKLGHMVHGAIWIREGWQAATWDNLGQIFDGPKAPERLDLDLTDWRDQIPWSCLRPEIVAVAKSPMGQYWLGLYEIPVGFCRTAGVWSMRRPACCIEGLYIPNAPSDWTQTLAIRPGCEKEDKRKTWSRQSGSLRCTRCGSWGGSLYDPGGPNERFWCPNCK